jgi:hypothetical protein
VRLVINKMPTKAWPDARTRAPDGFTIDPMWHLDATHSQLAAARKRFAKPGDGITIGHLDNGLDGRHPAAPFNLQRDDWRADAVGLLEYAMKRAAAKRAKPPEPPEKTGGSHGLGTAGILAGSWVAIDEQKVRAGRSRGIMAGWVGRRLPAWCRCAWRRGCFRSAPVNSPTRSITRAA